MPERMTRCLREAGYQRPTPVQQRCWPVCLSGRDLLCVAPTGSGKTLGYALPALALLRRWPPAVYRPAVVQRAVPLAKVAERLLTTVPRLGIVRMGRMSVAPKKHRYADVEWACAAITSQPRGVGVRGGEGKMDKRKG